MTEPKDAGDPDPSVMTQHGISFDGEYYHYGQYRYSKFTDAVAYAERQGGGR